jgi:hypothetical protein
MHFSTAIMALAATASLVAAQNKCDAQKYVSQLTHPITLRPQTSNQIKY